MWAAKYTCKLLIANFACFCASAICLRDTCPGAAARTGAAAGVGAKTGAGAGVYAGAGTGTGAGAGAGVGWKPLPNVDRVEELGTVGNTMPPSPVAANGAGTGAATVECEDVDRLPVS